MRQRCSNPRSDSYANYGGRGIVVCDRWLESFENFLSDMGSRPDDTTLDRIDSNGNYEPGNCRWATRSVQSTNRRNTPRIEFRGRALGLKEWARELGFHHSTLRERIEKWGVDRALSSPRVSREESGHRAQASLAARGIGLVRRPATSKARLSWPIVDAIRERHARGHGALRLRKAFGVGRATMRKILSGLIWPPETRPQPLTQQPPQQETAAP
jgi:hypothetical protein